VAAAAAERVIVVTVDTLRVQARTAPDPEEARAAWLAVRAHRPDDREARAALDSLSAMHALETAAWRDSLQSREQVLELAVARLSAASDSLAAARRGLESRDAQLSAQRAELKRLGMLRRAADALAANETTRAAAIADSLAAAYPGDPEVRALRGRIQPETDLLDPAHREEARRLYIEGMRRFNTGDYQGAIRFWEELLALDPGNSAVRLNLDEARARLGSGR
jgi:tetratricopeptide (TPR) repeat protein